MTRNQMTAVIISFMMTLPFGVQLPVSAVDHAANPGLHLAQFDSSTAPRQAAPMYHTAADGISALAKDDPLPDSFDLRSKGLVSSVKDQSPWGTCWAFSAINSIENSLIAREPDIDLSEMHLAYYTYCSAFGYPVTADSLFDEGSYDVRQDVGMLLSGIGPVYEEDCPYSEEGMEENEKTMDDLRKEAAFHVTSAKGYPLWSVDDESHQSQVQAMKRAILAGHALDARYTDADECHNETYHTYYYDYNLVTDDSNSGGHAISIIGWDDNVPASAFNSNPGSDGAWLVKNSWGVNWGDAGCYWISYAENTLYDVMSIEAEPMEPDMRVYQYDTYGNSGSYAIDPEGESTIYGANVFTAETDGALSEVMLCNLINDDTWELTVYTDLSDPSVPTSGTAVASKTVTFPEIGYQTVALDEPVLLHSGQTFAIVAKISGEDEMYHLPCEYATHSQWTNEDGSEDVSDSLLTIDMLKRDFNEGESFYSADGDQWFDIYLDGEEISEYEVDGSYSKYNTITGNVCIKAVTKDLTAVTFSDYHKTLPVGTKISLSHAGGSPIHYAVNDGDFQLYTEPITFKEPVTISAYAEGDVPIVYTQHYDVAAASISSLLCYETTYSWYEYAKPDEEDPLTLTYFIEPDTTEIEVMPISTGKIMIGDTELLSGTFNSLPVEGPTTYKISVTEEGLAPTEYTLDIKVFSFDMILYGDVNLDGAINASDAALILIYASKLGAGVEPELPDAQYALRADYNGDGVVNASDAAQVLIFAAAQGGKGVG